MHEAKVISVEHVADGILAVKVRCCGDPLTDSVLSLHELHRDDSEIDKDIQAHIAKVQQMHLNRERAKAHIERLIQK